MLGLSSGRSDYGLWASLVRWWGCDYKLGGLLYRAGLVGFGWGWSWGLSLIHISEPTRLALI
eukprot:4806049-Alexandrium_andersonii.AAC.1